MDKLFRKIFRDYLKVKKSLMSDSEAYNNGKVIAEGPGSWEQCKHVKTHSIDKEWISHRTKDNGWCMSSESIVKKGYTEYCSQCGKVMRVVVTK